MGYARADAARPVFETLEPRLLLSAMPLAEVIAADDVSDVAMHAEPQAALTQLAESVDAWMDDVLADSALADELPLVGESVLTLIDVGDLISGAIFDTMVGSYEQLNVVQSDQIVDALTDLDGQVRNGLDIALDHGRTFGGLLSSDLLDGVESDQIVFSTGFSADGSIDLDVDLGAEVAALGIVLEGGSGLTATLNFDVELIFGYDLDENLADEERAYLQVSELSADVALNVTDPQLDLRVGFLDAQINNGSLSYAAGIDVTLNDPTNDPLARVTRSDLDLTSPASLFDIAAVGDIDITLPIAASLGDFTPTGTPTLSILSDDPFDVDGLDVSLTDFEDLDPFTYMGAGGMLGVLQHMADVLSTYSDSDLMNHDLPFTPGVGLGDLADVGEALRAYVIDPLVVAEPDPENPDAVIFGQATFLSVQEMVDDLSAVLGVDESALNLVYDPATHELAFDLPLDYTFDPAVVDFGFAIDDLALAEVRSTAQVDVAANVQGGLRVGIEMAPITATLEGSADSPSDGVLSDAAEFAVMLGGLAPLAVRVERDETNASLNDLADDFNAAFAGVDLALELGNDDYAGLTLADMIEAKVEGNRLQLVTNARMAPAFVRLDIDATDPMITELHFEDGQMASDSITRRAFIEDASFEANVSLTASEVDLYGRFGFVDVDINDASASLTASVDYALANPDDGTPGGRITMPRMLEALRDDPNALVTGDGFSGTAQAHLPIQVQVGDLFGDDHPADPYIDLYWDDLSVLDPQMLGGPSLTYNDMDRLLDFENVSYGDLLGGLSDLATFLTDDLAGFSFLDADLPLINRSVSDLLEFGADFAQQIEAMQSDPERAAGTLGRVADALAEGLGIDPSLTETTLEEGMVRFDLEHRTDLADLAMDVDLDLEALFDTLPPELAGLSDLVSTTLEGEFTLDAHAVLTIGIGFDLSDPADPKLVIFDDTGFDLAVKAEGQNLDFMAGLGPLGLYVENGTLMLGDPADPDGYARIGVGIDPTAEGYYELDSLLGSLFDPSGPFDLSFTGEATATLPMFFPTRTNPLLDESETPGSNEFELIVADLANPIDSTTVTTPDLSSLLSEMSLLDNLQLLVEGVSWLMDDLAHGVSGEFAAGLPLIGDHLSTASEFVGDMRDKMIDALDRLDEVDQRSAEWVGDLIYDAIGPAGLGFATDRSQIVETVTADEILFELNLSVVDYALSSDLGFDVAIPGLDLDLDAEPTLALDFALDLAFGLNIDNGFFVETDGRGLSASADVTLPGASLNGRLAVLNLAVDDAGSFLSAAFDVDLTGGQSGRLSWDELTGDNGLGFATTITGDAELALDVVAGFTGAAAFPSLHTDIRVAWNGDLTTLPEVHFQDVQIDAGEFFSDFIGPILEKVRDVIDPLDPVIDALTYELPAVGATLLDLAALHGSVNGEFIEAIIDVVGPGGLVESIPEFDYEEMDEEEIAALLIPLGSFVVGDDGNGFGIISEDGVADLEGAFAGVSDDAGTFVEDSGQVRGGGFEIPLLSDPSMAFELLMGGDVALFGFDVPELSFDFSFSLPFGPFMAGPVPVRVELSGQVEGGLNLAFGYDTRGLRQFQESGDAASILNGFYVSDTGNVAGTGEDVTEAWLGGRLSASAAIDAVIASAGVRGGLGATVEADLRSQQDRSLVYLDELVGSAQHGLLCAFDISGSLDFFLEVFAEVAGSEVTRNVADIELVSFDLAGEHCFPGRFENNDTMEEAAHLGTGPGIHVSGDSIADSGDQDWYSFDLHNPDSLDVLLEFDSSRGHLNMDIYDENGERIARSRSSTDDEHIVLGEEEFIDAGRYFVHVYGEGFGNPYDLAITPGPTSETTVYYMKGQDFPAFTDEEAIPDDFDPVRHSYYTTADGASGNDGLSADSPLNNFSTLTSMYDIGDGDIVVFDTGSYSFDVTVTEAMSGVIFAGIPHDDYRYHVSYSTGPNIRESQIGDVTIDGADNVIIDSLAIEALSIEGAANNNLILNSIITGGPDPDAAALQFHANAEGADSAGNVVRDSEISGHRAVQIDSAGGQVLHDNVIKGAVLSIADLDPEWGVRVTDGGVAHLYDNVIEGVTERLVQPPLANAVDDATTRPAGVIVDAGADVQMHDNVIAGNTIGIRNEAVVHAIHNNEIRENVVGMAGHGLLGVDNVADANMLFDNAVGILLDVNAADVTVRYNTLFENNVGIRSVGDAVNHIYGNEVRDNAIGIQGGAVVGYEDWSEPNLIHGNSVGIALAAGGEVRFNRVYNNVTGIRASDEADGGHIHHNLVYRGEARDANDADPVGIELVNVENTQIENNTVYLPDGDAVRLSGSATQTTLRNNILWTGTGYALNVANAATFGLDSDHNNLYRTPGAGGLLVHFLKDFGDLYDWQVEAGQDVRSIGYTGPAPDRDDPLFLHLSAEADVDYDFRLSDVDSTSIAAGDPADDASLEPGFNGGRVNLGAYGNTAQAAEASQQLLRLTYPEFHVDWSYAEGRQIAWYSDGLTGDVTFELLKDDDGTLVGSAVTEDVATGELLWSPQQITSDISEIDHDAAYRIRATHADSGVVVESRETFYIPAPGNTYYVNDGDTTDTEYTTTEGDNRNHGRSADAPKASIVALLRMYDLGVGDTVHIDTGEYVVVTNVAVGAGLGLGDDQAVHVTGPTAADRHAVLDRVLTAEGTAVVEVAAGDAITVDHLQLRHGEHGLRVHGGTEGFEANDLHVSRSGDHGVQIALGSDGVALSGLTIRNVGGHGIDAAADDLLVSGADIRGADETGINLTGMNGTVQSSTIAANETGIEAFGDGGHLIGSEDLDAGLGNIIFENANGGIMADDSLVAGNHVHSHGGYTPAIRLYGDARATLNVVHHNRTGIQATSSGTTVDHNRVYANIDVGIRGGGNTNIHHNVVYSNDYGIRAEGPHNFGGGVSGDIAHNIIYDNASAGLFLDRADTDDPTPVFNNTFYELEGRAVQLGPDGAGVALRNNIFVTDTGTAIYLQSGSETGLTSDHNLFDIRGSGAVGFWQGSARNDYLAWRNASFQDANSIAAAPLFVSVSTDPSQIGYIDEQQDGRDDDFHVRSQSGSYHGGTLTPVIDAATGLPVQLDATLTMDAAHSPAINRGDDSDDNSNEPTPNGGYINLGAYGNTEQASESLDEYLLLMRPDGGESWPQEQTFTIDWRSHDTASNISIELLDDQDNVVHTIADNIADAGSHDWTVTDAVDTGEYVLRVTRHDVGISVTTSDVITITDPVTQYFVNDRSTTNDAYTTAIGDNANDGTSAATPMASIRAVIETYNLGAGDEILVDVGNYDVSNNVVLAAAESGIIIRGVYDPDDLAASTVLNRNSTASGSYVFEFDGASDVTIESLAIMGADSGIFADEFVGSTDVTISNVLFSGHGSSGITIDEDNDGWLIEASTFDGQNNNTQAIEAIAADNTVIRGNEMFGHDSRVIQVWASSSTSSFVSDTVTGTVIEQNTIYDNDDDGISTRHHIEGIIRENTVNRNRQGIIARGDNVLVENNIVHDNEFMGIEARDGEGLVIGNEVSGSSIGIYASDQGRIENNIVYGTSQEGIRGIHTVEIVNNRVFDSEIGIEATHFVQVVGNQVYSNTHGIMAGSSNGTSRFRGDIVNNLVYLNSQSEIYLNGWNESPLVANNTIYTEGRGIHLDGEVEDADLRNNIIQAVGQGTALVVDAESQVGFTSDYNLFDLVGDDASLANWGGTIFDSRADWFFEIGHDAHSNIDDPNFADPAGTDGVLGYDSATQTDYGIDDDFSLLSGSPGIDMGDPTFAFDNELSFNGGRINLGHHGNTEQATTSAAASLLQVLSPRGLEKWAVGETVQIDWRTHGLDEAGLVTIELIDADTGSVTATVAEDAANSGSFDWVIDTALQEDREYRLRITSDQGAGVWDESRDFLLVNDGRVFYVNDDSTDNVTWVTAAGDNTNSGKSVDNPMRSLAALMSAYDLQDGDTVYVDSGHYALNRNVIIDAGVAIVGVDAAGPGETVIDRANTAMGSYAFELDGATGASFESLTIVSGDHGIHADRDAADSIGVTITDNLFYDYGEAGVFIGIGNDDWLIEKSTFDGRSGNAYGININASGTTIRDVEMFDHDYGYSIRVGEAFNASAEGIVIEDSLIYDQLNSAGMYLDGSNMIVRNNVIHSTGLGIQATTSDVLIEGNTLYNQSGTGISADVGPNIVNNIVYGSGGNGISGGALVQGNVVYQNAGAGIFHQRGGEIIGNRVFANDEAGIEVSSRFGHSRIEGNQVYSNEHGIIASTSRDIIGNLVYDNAQGSLRIEDKSNPSTVANNTIISDAEGVRVRNGATNIDFRNNIVQVTDAAALSVTPDSQAGFSSDFNLFDVLGETGTLAEWGDVVFTDRVDWHYEIGHDAQSHFADPMFAGPAGADGVLGYDHSTQTDYGVDDDFSLLADSLGIAAGDPSFGIGNEPHANGGRINLGHHGNTAEATAADDPLISFFNLSDLTKLEQGEAFDVSFVAAGYRQEVAAYWFNIGNDTHAPWDALAPETGYSRTTGGTIDLSMVDNAAPESIYQSYYETNEGDGHEMDFAWSLQEGEYRLRLHFADTSATWSTSRFDVQINGETVIEDLDVTEAVGGNYTAYIEELGLEMTEAGEVDLRLISREGRAHIAGIEVIRVNPDGLVAPTFTVESTLDDGNSWQVVETGVGIDSQQIGSVTWTPDAATAGRDARVRITAEDGAAQTATSDAFLVANDGNTYYINDDATDNDEWVTAIGDNLNSGKSADSPMASLAALMSVYDLQDGDTIYADAGDYLLPRNVVIESGVHIIGVEPDENGENGTVFDRNNHATDSYVFELHGAHGATFEGLGIVSGEYGIISMEDNPSTNVQVLGGWFYDQSDYGIEIEADSNNWLIEGATFDGNNQSQRAGIYVLNANDVVLRNNHIFEQDQYGISLFGSGKRAIIEDNVVHDIDGSGIQHNADVDAVFRNNEVYASELGIRAGANALIEDNLVYDNIDEGIAAADDALVINNVAHGNRWGILAADGVNVENNVSYLNSERGIYHQGVYYGESGHVVDNRVFGNQGEGIATRYDVDVRRNQVYTNQHGIAVSGSSSFPFSGEISNNVVYDNLDSGISVAHVDEAAVLNNTVYQPVGVGVRLTEEATDFQLRNNIIWVDLGTALRVDSDTQPTFDSDYNLFWTGDVDPDGVDAVLWGTTELATLSDWQTATGQDLSSFDADPLFVDIDGPDDVLGFNEIVDQQLVDGGADDNFQLLPDSPGIDRGDTYLGTLDDYHGRSRHDDPGTPNGGSRIFNESLGGTGNFTEVGELFSTSSPEYYELPFAFEYYGQEFETLRMNRHGVLQFDSSRSDLLGVDPTAENLHNALRIAPFWAEMSTYSSEHDGVGIFIEEGTDFVTFRWRAVADADDGIVNFSVTLHEDGRIDFDYGEITSDVVPVIGLGGDHPERVQFAAHHGSSNVSHAESIRYDFVPGFADIGAFEFVGSSDDDTPPTVVGTTPAGIAAGAANDGIESFTLHFSEALDPISAEAPASYELLVGDGNGGFDGAIDLTPSYQLGDTEVLLEIDGEPLEEGVYQLTVSADAIRNESGLRLDGDSSGAAGGDYVAEFAIADAPSAALTVSDLLAAGVVEHTFTIDYAAAAGLDLSTIENNDTAIRVTGPDGFDQTAEFVEMTGDAQSASVTYQLTAPGATWTGDDTGTYTIAILEDQVFDTGGVAVPVGPLGTFEVDIDGVAPEAALTVDPITTGFGTDHTFTITYSDDRELDLTSIEDNDAAVRVTGPSDFDQLAEFVSVDVTGGEAVATYRITAPDGQWLTADNGTYSIAVEDEQVFDAAANVLDVGTLGSFAVDVNTASPEVAVAVSNLREVDQDHHAFTITYTDNLALDLATLENNDTAIRVTGPNDYDQFASFVSMTGDTDSATVTYHITPPDDLLWSEADNGTYAIAMEPGAVADVDGNAVAAGPLAEFDVRIGLGTELAIGDDLPGTLTFTDEHGVDVQITLDNAVGNIVVSGDNVDINDTGTIIELTGDDLRLDEIALTDSGLTTTLAITTSGRDARTTVGEIIVDGSLGTLDAGDADLLGNVDISGALESLTLGDVRGEQSTITIGSDFAGITSDLTLDRISDLSLSTGTAIDRFAATEWRDTDSTADQLQAPTMHQLLITGDRRSDVTGDFEAAMTLTDATTPALWQARIAGSVGSGDANAPLTWHAPGELGQITIDGDAHGWSLIGGGDLSRLLVGEVTGGSVAVAGEINQIMADDWNGGGIEAAALNQLRVSGDRISGLPGDYHADLNIASEDALLRTVLVAGDISGHWQVAGDMLRLQANDADDWTLDVDGDVRIISLNRVTDATINGDAAVGNIRVTDWQGGGIEAGSLRMLQVMGDRRDGIAGDFDGDLTLTDGQAGQTLGNVMINGDISGSTWTLAGDVGNLRLNDVNDWSLVVTGDGEVRGLQVDRATNANVQVSGELGNVRMTDWQGGSIEAGTLRVLQVLGDRREDIAGDFGVNLTLSDEQAGQSLNNVTIRGDVSGSTWTLAGDVGNLRLDDVSDWSLVVSDGGEVRGLQLGRATNVSVQVAGAMGNVRATEWQGGSIEADSMRLLQVRGDRRDGIAGDFNADLTLHDDQTNQTMNAARINGTLTSATWDIAGAVGTIAADAAMDWTLEAAGEVRSLQFGQVRDVDVSVAGDLGTVRATDWRGGSIQAETLRTLQTLGDRRADVAGDFEADLTLTDAEARWALNRVQISDTLLGGNWQIAGAVGHLLTGAIGADDDSGPRFSMTAQGETAQVRADTIRNADLTLHRLRMLNVQGDIVNASVTLTDGDDANVPGQVLGNANVRGKIDQSTIRSAGSVGRFYADAMHESDLFVGLDPQQTQLPEATDDVASVFADASATLGSLQIRGSGSDDGPTFRNSRVAAGQIGQANLGLVDPSSVAPGGIAGTQMDRLDYERPDGSRVRMSDVQPGDHDDEQFMIRIL